MLETVVREELEDLKMCPRITSSPLRAPGPGSRKDRLATPHVIVTMALGPDVSRVRAITLLCGLRTTVEFYTARLDPLQYRRFQRFGQTKRGCGYASRCVACGEAHLSSPCFKSKQDLKSWLVGWSVGRMVGGSVGRLVGWSVGRSVGQSIGRLVGRLVGR
jgi:hypothetical protein